jgi:hypothetical protein
MAGLDVQRAAEWIVARLAADATLTSLGITGVFDGNAPGNQAYPFVRVGDMTNLDTTGVGGEFLLNSALFQVVVVGETRSYAELRPAAERVHVLLHQAFGATSDLTEIVVVREEVFRQAAYDLVDIRELGGYYRAYVRAA